MYKVFFKDRIISLCNDTNLLNSNEYTFVFTNIDELKQVISDFIHDTKNYTIVHNDLDELWYNFNKCMEVREAAGGIVIKDNAFLAIKRWGLWDLPKGHVEKGETVEIAAIREVEEETGITNPAIKEKLPNTYHLYLFENNLILKISHWFKMSYSKNENLVPQIEEDITEAIWMPIRNKEIFIRNTYPTLYDTIELL